MNAPPSPIPPFTPPPPPSGVAGYDFLCPQRIVFGWGRRTELPRLARSLGERAFLVLGSQTLEKAGFVAQMVSSLELSGVAAQVVGRIAREPEPSDVNTAAAHILAAHPRKGDFVLAVGGGSALDLGKAAAAMAMQPLSRDVADYLEGVGKGLTLSAEPLPILAMPTTAGTGSEATKNAVISSYDPPYKKSLRADAMLPRIVLVDPELTVGLPRDATAWTGMDCIVQLIESAISCRSAPIPRALAAQGLAWAVPALEAVLADPGCRWGREKLAHAALLSGMALANSGLGLAHGVAAALGCLAKVPHGLACAAMLPTALAYNRETSEAVLAELGRDLVPASARRTPGEIVDAFFERLDDLLTQCAVPRTLRELGVSYEQIPRLADLSRGNSLSGNPRPVDGGALEALLTAMW